MRIGRCSTPIPWSACSRTATSWTSRISYTVELPAAVADPVATALLRNARAMIDVDYAGSPLVADYGGSGAGTAEPHPGQRYRDWTRFGGTSHHVLVFGPVADAEALARLGRRWSRLVEISRNPGVAPFRAGVATGGVVLIRPDGHIGFRFPTADARALAAHDVTIFKRPTGYGTPRSDCGD